MFIIIILIVIVSFWYHWNHVPAEKNIQNFNNAVESAKYIAAGTAAGIYIATKDKESGYK